MTENNPSTMQQLLKQLLGDKIVAIEEHVDTLCLDVAPVHWQAVARILRDNEQFSYEQMIDLCGVDYLGFGSDEWDTDDVSNLGFSRGIAREGAGRFDWQNTPESHSDKRFAAVVNLLSISNNWRLRIRCFASDNDLPIIPSLIDIWSSADWFEREAFDLFGIIFEGHPDLRRILTDYGFIGHPFRKDFPLTGNVECRYDAEKQRVIYQPVSIEPRVLVPRVVRDDSRYQRIDPASKDEGQS